LKRCPASCWKADLELAIILVRDEESEPFIRRRTDNPRAGQLRHAKIASTVRSVSRFD
jgi:hypothetical protein